MFRVVLLVAITACASARPWKPAYTVATEFEGEHVELASGDRINESCTRSRNEDHDYPLWGGCTKGFSHDSETYVRWGSRERTTLLVPGYLDWWQPPPRLESLRVLRLSEQVVAFELRAKGARWSGEAFLCRQKPDGCIWSKTPVRAASLEEAHAQAMARSWDARDLDKFFGPSPQHHAHAIARHEWPYLDSRWPDLPPATRQLALSAAIEKDDESFIQKHWEDLDPATAHRAIDLFVEHDRYAFLARDPWWSKLSPTLQRRLVDLAIDAVPSLERDQFLGDRVRETGDERLRAALQRRRY